MTDLNILFNKKNILSLKYNNNTALKILREFFN